MSDYCVLVHVKEGKHLNWEINQTNATVGQCVFHVDLVSLNNMRHITAPDCLLGLSRNLRTAAMDKRLFLTVWTAQLRGINVFIRCLQSVCDRKAYGSVCSREERLYLCIPLSLKVWGVCLCLQRSGLCNSDIDWWNIRDNRRMTFKKKKRKKKELRLQCNYQASHIKSLWCWIQGFAFCWLAVSGFDHKRVELPTSDRNCFKSKDEPVWQSLPYSPFTVQMFLIFIQNAEGVFPPKRYNIQLLSFVQISPLVSSWQ